MSALALVYGRWTRWRHQKAAAARSGLRTYPICRHQVGVEPCCCGDPACPSGWPRHCYERISLWRYLRHGTCPEHT